MPGKSDASLVLGRETPSRTVLVSKIGICLPGEIKLWYQDHRHSLFVDRPHQCQNCWALDHATRACYAQKICRVCGSAHMEECSAEAPTSALCTGLHSADDRSCPNYQAEIEIRRLKSTSHISISEARRIYRQTSRNSKK